MKIFICLPDTNLKIQIGNTIHIKELAENLSKMAEVDVLTTSDRLASVRIPFMTTLIHTIPDIIKAAVLVHKKRPDLLYSRESLFTFPLAKLFRIPLIVEVNGLFFDEWRLTKASGIKKWTGYILCSLHEKTYKYADHLIAVTANIKGALQSKYKIDPKKITVVENGANIELFRPMDIKEARGILGLSQDYHYVCFIGSLIQWQGVEFLVSASPAILKRYPNTSFLIVGNGPTYYSLIDLAGRLGVSSNFIFTGTVPYERVPLYINASDICVVPKRAMSSGYSPLKLYEYMACGKPVIASRISGFEVLEECNAGLLVNPEDLQEFAGAINSLLADPQLRILQGENGRRQVVENRSWKIVAGKVYAVCRMVVESNKD
jgi:glycosyltransferase involved in cell wall biosynthesis